MSLVTHKVKITLAAQALVWPLGDELPLCFRDVTRPSVDQGKLIPVRADHKRPDLRGLPYQVHEGASLGD